MAQTEFTPVGEAAELAMAQAAVRFERARTSDKNESSPPMSVATVESTTQTTTLLSDVRLMRLVNLPSTAELHRQREIWQRSMTEISTRRMSVSEQVAAKQEVKRNMAKLDAQLVMAAERDELQAARRVDGCTCLGTGEVPHWQAVETGVRYCECEDGVLLKVRENLARQVREEETRPARVRSLVERINLPGFITDHGLTLETFEPDPAQRQTYSKLLAASNADPRSIILFGEASKGKTGLLATLLLRWVERNARPGKYWPAVKLMDEITRQAHQEIGDEGDVLWSAGRIPYLMIDDIDKLRLSTSFSIERFYQLINARYDAGLVTLVTTNMTIEQLTAKMDAYVVDRLVSLCGGFEGGWVMELFGRNRRT